MAQSPASGRLLSPDTCLGTEPRIHPGLLAGLVKYGMHKNSSGPKDITLDSSIDEIGTYLLESEKRTEAFLNTLSYSLPDDHLLPSVVSSEDHVQGSDGNSVRLIIHRPESQADGTLPAVVYFHGGGMVTLKTDNALHTCWAKNLAAAGVVVIAVDFRNAATTEGWCHFPAGLNDCAAAVRWIDSQRTKLRISKIILQGESGGANLALATALKANREGWVSAIDGVYAWVPGISNAYNWTREKKLQELPSLVESDGYFLDCVSMAIDARMYEPSGNHSQDPLAWPYWAGEADLKGLPPHVIATSELDPLRDEGIAYYRKLVNAGVKAVGRVNLGMIHAGEMILRSACGDAFFTTVRDVKCFAESL